MRSKVRILVIIASVVLLLFFVPLIAALGLCSQVRGPTNQIEPATVVQKVTHVDTLSQAESLLPFQVALPSFLPAGTSRTPELLVLHDDDGKPEQLEAMYWEEDTVSPDVSRMRMTVIELSGRSFLPDTLNFEVVDIDGVSVQFATRPFGGDLTEAVAAWSHEGIGYHVEFRWLSDDETSDGEITDQMRADALKVIESIIE